MDRSLTLLEVPPRHVVWGTARVPLGKVVAGITETGELCRATYVQNREVSSILEQWQRDWPATDFSKGKIPKDLMTLPVAMVGTGLQQVFWLQIMDIPVGKVASYGEIAELAGAPGRARAVGKACNTCTVDYMVPCHRVVAAGGLGGYGRDGTAFKEELLRAEGVVLPVGKRTARHYSQG